MFESTSGLDGSEAFSGFIAVLTAMLVGFELYSWLWQNKPPKLAIVWVPWAALSLWRRVVTGVNKGRWPTSWYLTLGAYSLVILALAVIKGPRVSDDWWVIGAASFYAVASFWKGWS